MSEEFDIHGDCAACGKQHFCLHSAFKADGTRVPIGDGCWTDLFYAREKKYPNGAHLFLNRPSVDISQIALISDVEFKKVHEAVKREAERRGETK